jgi:hypothetical protein
MVIVCKNDVGENANSAVVTVVVITSLKTMGLNKQ